MFKTWAYYQLSYVVKKQLSGNCPEWYRNDVLSLGILNEKEITNLFGSIEDNFPLVSVIVPCYNTEQYVD